MEKHRYMKIGNTILKNIEFRQISSQRMIATVASLEVGDITKHLGGFMAYCTLTNSRLIVGSIELAQHFIRKNYLFAVTQILK